MERFVTGDIIVLEFPYSDLRHSKKRPALIIKVPKGEDVIICQITAESQNKEVELSLKDDDFSNGKLKRDSYIRIDKITTIKKTRIKYKVGSLKKEKFTNIINSLCNYLKST